MTFITKKIGELDSSPTIILERLLPSNFVMRLPFNLLDHGIDYMGMLVLRTEHDDF